MGDLIFTMGSYKLNIHAWYTLTHKETPLDNLDQTFDKKEVEATFMIDTEHYLGEIYHCTQL